MKKIYFLIFTVALVSSHAALAQTISATTYPFTTSGGVTLQDMSSGTTSLIGVSQDDGISGLQNIGFDFWFVGTRYTQFSANSNGLVRLGNTAALGTSSNDLTTITNVPQIAPYWDDLATGTTGSVLSKVVGTAPNRKLVIQWFVTVPKGLANPANATFQCVLNETSGKIDFVYGTGMVANATNSGASIGFGTSATVFASTTLVSPSSSSTASYAAANNANTMAIDAGTQFSYTPLVPAVPINLTYTFTTATSTTLNWVDNSTTEYNFAVYRSTDNINFTLISTVPSSTSAATGGAYSGLQTGLSPNTQYYYQVYAVSEGALSATALTGNQTTASCSIAGGTYTVGATGTYTSVANALTALIANGITGAVVLELQTNYAPEGAITFGLVPCASLTNTITIRPAAGVAAPIVLTDGNSAPTFNFNGGQFYIIDGRNGGAGTNKFITIANSSTTGQAVQFINEGTGNVIKYCTIQGVNTSTTSGVIVFSTTTGAIGNDNNTIDNCDIKDGSTTPTNAIYSSGSTATTAQNNSGNTISSNNIFNYFAAGSDHYGVNITGGNTDWSVTNNSFYQTSARVVTGPTTSGIRISSTSSNNNLISGNYIGGTAPLCGGTALTYTGSTPTSGVFFRGLQFTVGTTTATSVQGNTIQNLSLTSGITATAQSGISLISGRLNVGDVTGNIIGSQSLTNSIIFTTTSTSTTLPTFTGILAGTGTGDITNISNNTIAGIIVSTGNTGSVRLRGIGFQGTTGTFTISNNTIGSTSTPNSITNTTNNSFFGIFGSASNTTATQTINNNTVANIRSTSTFSSAQVIGILAQGSTGGIYNTSGNTVRDITNTAPNVGTSTGASVIGISHTAATTAGQALSQNTIFNLSNSNASAATIVTGIQFSGSTSNTVERNLIYDLTTATNSGTAEVNGIRVDGGTTLYKNNMIRIGTGISNAIGSAATNSSTVGVVGINEAVGTDQFFHNSVYISGAPTSGSGASYSFNGTQTTNTRSFRDNIFFNARSNTGATGSNYAIKINGTAANPTGLTINNNDYFVNGTGGVFGFFNSANVADLAAWKTAVGQDVNSISADPLFTSPTDLHISSLSSPVVDAGADVSVTNDFDAQARPAGSGFDIGADEVPLSVVAVGVEYFRGSKAGTANFLDWKVNCSSDPSVRLILERSADSRTFKAIQDQNVTAARCAQGFSYTDAAPPAGINYYRLKTISPDGAFRYSMIVALINKDKGFELISVAPNPVKTNTVLSISTVKAGRMSIAVSDMTGKVVMTQNINVIAGNNPITMNFATLGAGTYNIKVINADNEVKATRFVKY